MHIHRHTHIHTMNSNSQGTTNWCQKWDPDQHQVDSWQDGRAYGCLLGKMEQQSEQLHLITQQRSQQVDDGPEAG